VSSSIPIKRGRGEGGSGDFVTHGKDGMAYSVGAKGSHMRKSPVQMQTERCEREKIRTGKDGRRYVHLTLMISAPWGERENSQKADGTGGKECASDVKE